MSTQIEPQPQAPVLATPGRGRRIAVYVLLVLAGILLLLSSFAVWINRVALNTDEFVAASSALIEDDAIREAIAARSVDELYANVDVEAELRKQAPKDVKPLSGVAAAGLREAAYRVVDRALKQSALQRVWAESLRQSHETLVQVLEGNESTVSTQEGAVTLDLRELVLDTASRIGIRDTVDDKLPADVGRVEILRSDELDTAQNVFELLKALAWFLPVLTLGAFALALWLGAGRRREAVREIGITIFVVGVLGLVATNFTGSYLVDSLVEDRESRTAAGDAWDILTELLRSSFRWFIVVGVLFVVAAWLAGPGRRALAARQLATPFLRERLYPYAGLAVVALVLLVAGPVTDFAHILSALVIIGLLVAGVEVLRKQTLREFPEGAGTMSLGEARGRISDWLESRRAAPSGGRTVGGNDMATRLKLLADLHASGALTDEEFTAAKARVLAGE